MVISAECTRKSKYSSSQSPRRDGNQPILLENMSRRLGKKQRMLHKQSVLTSSRKTHPIETQTSVFLQSTRHIISDQKYY